MSARKPDGLPAKLALWPWGVTLALVLLPVRPVTAIEPSLARFITAKENQVRQYAQGLAHPVPAVVWSLFDAVRVEDWVTATNLAAQLSRASGRYPEAKADESLSPALNTLIWPPISEVIGAYGEFHDWDKRWLRRFGRDIIDSIPRGSIYFGGTDPGRFLISALSESQWEGKPFFTLTQNQLADATYLDYVRRMYGDQIHLPDSDAVQSAFRAYIADAQGRLERGQLKPGEEVREVDGRIQVSGPVAVMAINSLLLKTILNENRDRHFYLEESFPLEWMYPQLSPHDLIFELHTTPLSVLPDEAIRKDQQYWNRLVGELIGEWLGQETSVKEVCDFADQLFLRKDLSGFKGDRGFARNESAQKCFSKLRTSQAGLYVWRMAHARDAAERAQAQTAADLAFRQAYVLCPALPEALFGYTKFLTDVKRPQEAFLVGKTSLRLTPTRPEVQALVRALSKAQ